MKKLLTLVMLVGLVATNCVQAEPADLLKPYVDNQTALVVRVDLSKVDMGALKTWLLDSVRQPGLVDVKDAERALDDAFLPASAWMMAFTKSGGRFIYVLGDTTFQEPIILVPVETGANPVALQGSLPRGVGGYQSVVRANVVVCARPERLQQIGEGTQRPEIAAALAACGDAMFAVAVVPSADSRRVISQLLPALPPEAGGGPTAPLIGSCEYGILTLDLKPKVTLNAFMQAGSANDAAAAAGAMTGALNALRKDRHVSDVPGLADALAMVKPTAQAKRVDLSLDAASSRLAAVGVGGMLLARERASIMIGLNNAKQLLMGCHMYANDHKGMFPTELDAVVTAGFVPKAMLNVAHRPGEQWVYLVPPRLDKLPDSSRQIVLYEPVKPWPKRGAVVGFADGHVELIKDEAKFDDQMKASEKTIKDARN